MTRSSSLVERPILRLLLLALMGLALASRLALGATLSVPGADAADPLAKLQAAMIMCHAGPGHEPATAPPQGPRPIDLLLFDQADNAHAVPSNAVDASPVASCWFVIDNLAVHATARPPLWRPVGPARGPPATL